MQKYLMGYKNNYWIIFILPYFVTKILQIFTYIQQLAQIFWGRGTKKIFFMGGYSRIFGFVSILHHKNEKSQKVKKKI
jgi:hypothetical protein